MADSGLAVLGLVLGFLLCGHISQETHTKIAAATPSP